MSKGAKSVMPQSGKGVDTGSAVKGTRGLPMPPYTYQVVKAPRSAGNVQSEPSTKMVEGKIFKSLQNLSI
jgi:hypothetical protein